MRMVQPACANRGQSTLVTTSNVIAALVRARPDARSWFARWCLSFVDAAAAENEDALDDLHASMLIF